MSKGSFNHACCDACWWANRSGDNPRGDRVPVRIKEEFRDPDERCCWCGQPTRGIFLRQDPKQVHGAGRRTAIGPFEGEGL